MSRLFLRPYTKSVAFDGSVSILEKTSPTGINNGTNGSVTVSGWVYLTSELLSTFAELYVSGNTSPAFGLGQQGSVYYVFSDRVNAGNNSTITKASFYQNIGLNRWTMMTYVLTSTRIAVYANATQILDNALGVAINAGTLSSITVGNGRLTSGTLTQPLQGYMKDVLFFNGALSAAEVTKLYYYNIRPSSLVASYLMEEGSGSTIADGTGSNNLTGASITWSSTYLPTQARTAIPTPRLALRSTPYSITNVASTTAGLTIPNNAALNPTSAVTLACWFYLSGKNTYHSLFDNSEGGVTNSYFFDYYEGSGFRWYSVIGGAAKNITGTATKPVVGSWNFVTATYTGSAIYIYLNGVKLAEELAASGALGTNSGILRMGRSWNALAAGALVGNLYRPMIFNVGCTLQEHKDMYYANKFSAALTAGKVLDLAMTEGSGSTIADVSATGATATIGAADSWSANYTPFRIPMALRNYNYSLSFNGSNQYVDLGTSGSIAQESAAFSVSAWVNQSLPAVGSIVTVVGDTDVANARFQFQFVDGKVRSYVKTSGTSANFLGNLSFIPNSWNHVVMTFDGSFARSYINGVLDQTITCTGTCSASTAGMAIGRGFSTARYWPGKIARVQYWNARAITPFEIQKIYRSGADSYDTSIRSGMTGEWKLDEGSGTTAVDTFGLNNGTITGATYSTSVPFIARTAS